MKNNEAEALLLSNASLDDLIKMKIEKEFMADLKKSKEKVPVKVYTDIKLLSKDEIFSMDNVLGRRSRLVKTIIISFPGNF